MFREILEDYLDVIIDLFYIGSVVVAVLFSIGAVFLLGIEFASRAGEAFGHGVYSQVYGQDNQPARRGQWM